MQKSRIRRALSIFGRNIFGQRRSRYKEMLELREVDDRFKRIHDENLWGSKESVSGEGSELGYTENLRRWLPDVISRYDIRRISDAPCGDFNWMRYVLDGTSLEYVGYDIVSDVIEKNKKSFGGGGCQFFQANICRHPIQDCDLLITRDALIHMSFRDVDSYLKNISRVNYKYLLTTTHYTDADFVNRDILSGDVRLIDLFKPPFLFERNSVLERVDDYPEGYPIRREMILIRKEDVPTGLST